MAFLTTTASALSLFSPLFMLLSRMAKLFGGDSKGLYMLNSELKTRVYTAPSLVL